MISLCAIPHIQRGDRVTDFVVRVDILGGNLLGHIAYCPDIYTIELSWHTQFLNTNHS